MKAEQALGGIPQKQRGLIKDDTDTIRNGGHKSDV